MKDESEFNLVFFFRRRSYHLYLFKHTHEGDYLESIVFIYSMPGYSCPVKERMMYSSVKATFCETIQKLGLDIVKRVSANLFLHFSGCSPNTIV